MADNIFLKDPEARLDFSFDWSEWLANGENITVSEMEVTTGLTIDEEENSLTSTTAWLEGGTVGKTYRLTNKITTNQERTDRKSITIRVTNR